MWLSGILVSLLPARYRRGYETDAISGGFRSGVLEVVVAFVVYGLLFFRYLRASDPYWGGTLASPGLLGQEAHWMSFGLGAISWLAFTISPGPLAAMYFMVEGVVRAISASVILEPLSSLPFWLAGKAHDALDSYQARRRVAPPAPDIVDPHEPGAEWDFRVTAVRAKPDWHSLVQVEYNGVLYHIISGGEEVVNGQARFRYYLKKSPPVGAFHGIVRYDPFEYWKTEGQ